MRERMKGHASLMAFKLQMTKLLLGEVQPTSSFLRGEVWLEIRLALLLVLCHERDCGLEDLAEGAGLVGEESRKDGDDVEVDPVVVDDRLVPLAVSQDQDGRDEQPRLAPRAADLRRRVLRGDAVDRPRQQPQVEERGKAPNPIADGNVFSVKVVAKPARREAGQKGVDEELRLGFSVVLGGLGRGRRVRANEVGVWRILSTGNSTLHAVVAGLDPGVSGREIEEVALADAPGPFAAAAPPRRVLARRLGAELVREVHAQVVQRGDPRKADPPLRRPGPSLLLLRLRAAAAD
mmetsp:Transcript_18257/g.37797  ORF Transcript_18257/g.37797 Transcript_18257/m.37797 type:complete len:292 (-) Transcript_18257:212-1087(-)